MNFGTGSECDSGAAVRMKTCLFPCSLFGHISRKCRVCGVNLDQVEGILELMLGITCHIWILRSLYRKRRKCAFFDANFWATKRAYTLALQFVSGFTCPLCLLGSQAHLVSFGDVAYLCTMVNLRQTTILV